MKRRQTVRIAITACALFASTGALAQATPPNFTIDPPSAATVAQEAVAEASPIPEPAGLVLLAAGLSTMVLMRRRLG